MTRRVKLTLNFRTTGQVGQAIADPCILQKNQAMYASEQMKWR